MSAITPQRVSSRRQPRHRTYFTAIHRQTTGAGFFDDACKDFYLSRLLHCQQAFQVQLHAYLLTQERILLLFTPLTTAGFESFLKFLNRSYNDYYLTRFERRVRIWHDKSSLCPLPHNKLVIDCQKFIERYFLDAGELIHPGQYRYSSYCANAFSWEPKFLVRHTAIAEFTGCRGQSLQTYRDLIATPFCRNYLLFLQNRLLFGREILSSKAGIRLVKSAALTDI